MLYTQLKISNSDNNFIYAIEYVDNVEYRSSNIFSYSVPDDYTDTTNFDVDFIFHGTDEDIINNVWSDGNNLRVDNTQHSSASLPPNINMSSVNLYFPQNSLEVYETHPLYSVQLYTYIHGKKIVVGSYIVDRMQSLACSEPVTIKNIQYPEYVNIPIVDPWYLTYAAEWMPFRDNIIFDHDYSHHINNDGSLLYVELNAVEYDAENNMYIRSSQYNGGFGAMILSSGQDDYMGDFLHVEYTNPDDPDIHEFCVVSDVMFNDAFDNLPTRDENFAQYLHDTYNLLPDTLQTTFEMVIKDENNIYSYKAYQYDHVVASHTFSKEDINYTSWGEYAPGMRMTASVIIENRDTLVPVATLMSNEIPVTPDLFSYIVVNREDNELPDYIQLSDVDLRTYNINVVNKIKKEIINVSRPDDYKSNIVKPIFIKVNPADNINIHPNTNESIAINLDAYKNYTDVFYLQVEGITFPEVARTIYGVVFSITGSTLPCAATSGIYYLLDANKQLVTTGNYTYIL